MTWEVAATDVEFSGDSAQLHSRIRSASRPHCLIRLRLSICPRHCSRSCKICLKDCTWSEHRAVAKYPFFLFSLSWLLYHLKLHMHLSLHTQRVRHHLG